MGEQKIEILVATKVWNPQEWVDRLNQFDTTEKVHIWPTEANLSNVEALFVWKPLDAGVIEKLPNLKWISSLGAGVDHLVNDSQIPLHIPITRIVDPYLTRDMTNYVIMGVLMHQRSISAFAELQKKHKWDRLPYRNLKVGVLGLGVLGAHCATYLSQLGFETSGYSRTQKSIADVTCYSGNDMDYFLSDLDVLVNLLPVTPKTESVLNKDLFTQMKKGAYLINVARGNHLVEKDLLDALNKGHLSGALLDVFRKEPLPKANQLWSHPKVTITPHVASVSQPESVLNLLRLNIQNLIDDKPLLHQVNKAAGY